VSSCLIVKNIAKTVFRCTKTIKKTSSANMNMTNDVFWWTLP